MSGHPSKIWRQMIAIAFGTLLITEASEVLAQYHGDSAYREDQKTCDDFGASPGSKAYSKCMLVQQQRRDDAPLRAAEQQRLSAEAARHNLETVRRMRCEREAKRERRRGEHPREC